MSIRKLKGKRQNSKKHRQSCRNYVERLLFGGAKVRQKSGAPKRLVIFIFLLPNMRITLFLVVLVLLFAFQTPLRNKVPPGTTRVSGNYFVDKTEVTNIGWLEFTFWVKNSGDSIAYAEALPDTCAIDRAGNEEGMFFCGDMGQNYFRHPKFLNYPVIGISHKQAFDFCAWRSMMVNKLIQLHPERFAFSKVHYRLPSEEEWMQLAAINLDLKEFPFGLKRLYSKKGEVLVNTGNERAWRGDGNEATAATWRIDVGVRGIANSFNWIGNVSEMVVEEGIAKGGNFQLPLDSCRVLARQYYTKQEAWLGFRCVATVD
jgi:hypothetical protein